MGRNAGRCKLAYIWISPDPVKARPTLGVVVVDDDLKSKFSFAP